jgi:hypothetical protein
MAGRCAPSSTRCRRFSDLRARRIAALPASTSTIALKTHGSTKPLPRCYVGTGGGGRGSRFRLLPFWARAPGSASAESRGERRTLQVGFMLDNVVQALDGLDNSIQVDSLTDALRPVNETSREPKHEKHNGPRPESEWEYSGIGGHATLLRFLRRLASRRAPPPHTHTHTQRAQRAGCRRFPVAVAAL